MSIIETLITEFKGNTFTSQEDVITWLDYAFERVYREGQKNGKSAYKGQLKREWYMRGFEEGQKAQEKKQ